MQKLIDLILLFNSREEILKWYLNHFDEKYKSQIAVMDDTNYFYYASDVLTIYRKWYRIRFDDIDIHFGIFQNGSSINIKTYNNYLWWLFWHLAVDESSCSLSCFNDENFIKAIDEVIEYIDKNIVK